MGRTALFDGQRLAPELPPRRAELADMIRVAIRGARAGGDTATADELIAILEDMDREAAFPAARIPPATRR
jgi:hypothetical protein